jgi:hypothetical protein
VYALILVTCGFDNAASYYPALRTSTGNLETNRESSFHLYGFDYDEQGDHWKYNEGLVSVLIIFILMMQVSHLVVKLLSQPGSRQ